MFQTGLGMNLLIMTVMSFIVGLSISGQTFYTFVLENLEKFGALKAMGAKSRELILMILFQASFTALTGYGLGIGLCALTIALAKMRLPDYAAMITLLESGAGLRDGGDHRGRFELFRRPQGVADRAVRYFPRLMICRNRSDQSNRHRQVVRRRRSQNDRPKRRQSRRLFRRNAVHRGSVRQRQDDAAERALRHSQAGFRQRLRGRSGHLEAWQATSWPISACTRSGSYFRTIICFPV